MVWDKSKPVTNSALVSAELRANWDALDTQLLAPVVAAAPEQVLKVGAGDVLAGIPAGTNTHVLTLVSGVPTWAAPAGGAPSYPLLAPSGTPAAPSYSFSGDTTTGVYRTAATNYLGFNHGGGTYVAVGTNLMHLGSTTGLGWASGDVTLTGGDVYLRRSGPAILALRGATSTAGASLNFAIPTVPGTPGSGTAVLYQKADKKPYWKDDAGLETALGGLANPMSAIGDLIVGTTAGAPARLAAVATGAVLASAGVGTTPTWNISPSLTSLTVSTNLESAWSGDSVLVSATAFGGHTPFLRLSPSGGYAIDIAAGGTGSAIGVGTTRIYNNSVGELIAWDSGGHTSLRAYDGTGYQFKQVWFGPTDSGGAGYRMMRVPN